MQAKDESLWMALATFLGSILLLILVIAGAVGVIALVAYVFMLLWNAVVFGIFGGPELTYWQAFLVYLFLSMIGGFFKRSGK